MVNAMKLINFFTKDLKPRQKQYEAIRAMTSMNAPYKRNRSMKIRKRSTTQILLGVEKLNKDIIVPWLDYIPLKIVWTP